MISDPLGSPTLEVTEARKRHVSTTSSRFFPGGWFSSSPVVPDAPEPEVIPDASDEADEKKKGWGCVVM